ncbi:cupin [Pseudomonas sp. NPDC089406]|uniref:cupin n=1 Tax=Pseudomonas sp. NPDC089406 TaxID=3364463 RepID=UPI00384D248C
MNSPIHEQIESPIPSYQADAEFFEYSKAANPIGSKLISRIPYRTFPASLHQDGESRIVPLDLSEDLGCIGPATGPGLCANFIRLVAGDTLHLSPNATSQVLFVITGEGHLTYDQTTFNWSKGCFIALPATHTTKLKAASDCQFYYVHDEPLLRYLGVEQRVDRFVPTLYTGEEANAYLREAAADPRSSDRSRISILLGNRNFPQTRTVTHVLWAMYGLVPAGAVQKPHRHQSIALDFIVDCPPGCYSLVGPQIDDAGNIVNPTRIDWNPGLAFVTPPGYWHAHFNESSQEAFLIPIQDAGLQTWLRALDIRFS